MGYDTKFKGELKFAAEPTARQLAKLTSMLGEDCRDHKEWDAQGVYHIDLELTEDLSALKWDGSEKTYDMDKIVNVVIREMRKDFPDFGLTGSLTASALGDVWKITIREDGFAKVIE